MNEKKGTIEAIAEPLLAWYDCNARVLPWREKPTPYRVWVSEIMLQQTRVEAVKPYFERFMAALPDIAALAKADEESLLKLWEGLGYYNRVRNLQKAAKMVMEEYDGELPSDWKELQKLPGIGSYTAGAVSSIAYGKAFPAVDGNVLRVITRVTADTSDIMDAKVRKQMEESLLRIMPKKRAGDFNQALMELGAVICIPNGAPKCEECPWMSLCAAREKELIGQIPVKTPKKARKIEEITVFIIKDGDRTAIRKRSDKGLLAGMYEFPYANGYLDENEVLKIMKRLGFWSIRIQQLEASKHIFTHKEWHMKAYAIQIDEPVQKSMENGLIFADALETEQRYPIPSAFAAYTKYLNIRLGIKKKEQAT